ncbi:hypothetical protein RO3G_17243 [Rhizopus delemar RA 99-880]|uniref:Uncharacterized protein n=1 Tax=Rhizopus delemar (strain RA 99-880 / ATCC MYA-4621 / FGSC 9543 / NRRL 43880) TaxID=246409 RepID=I1CV92_RHIO9|nr:hypothetical protein RO3G_17243 [Rhizopus delemar RA 99-880]|eukprot:EIE92372.1 hypothetical protein RO3G_17243 [Rhizopus delemar RA 99-880]
MVFIFFSFPGLSLLLLLLVGLASVFFYLVHLKCMLLPFSLLVDTCYFALAFYCFVLVLALVLEY